MLYSVLWLRTARHLNCTGTLYYGSELAQNEPGMLANAVPQTKTLGHSNNDVRGRADAVCCKKGVKGAHLADWARLVERT